MDSQQDYSGELAKPKRNSYFYGKLLTADHLRMEQGYLNWKRWLLNALSLGDGVLVGLQVTVTELDAGERVLCISPGVAIDAWGREIVVSAEELVNPWQLTDEAGCPQGDPLDRKQDHDVSICLVYKECDDDYERVWAGDCHTKDDLVAGAVVEDFRVRVKEGKAEEPGGIAGLCAALRGETAGRRAAVADVLTADHDPPDDPPCVPLATVHLPAGDPIGSEHVTPTTRRLYSNETLLEMILCLAARIEECCQEQPAPIILGIEPASVVPQDPQPGAQLPIAVRVFNAADNSGVGSVDVEFVVTGGEGSVDDPLVGTNSQGVAESLWTLGEDEGLYTLRAFISKEPHKRVEFQARAVLPPPPVEENVLRIGTWQKVTSLNPYLSIGRKDILAASLVLEPLACYDDRGNLVPVLADYIPTVENGGIAPDFKSITWTLKEGVKWSDGTKLRAEDAVRTFEYVRKWQPCAASTRFADVESVEAPNDLTVKINFAVKKVNPYGPFVSYDAPILQGEQLDNERCYVDPARDCSGLGFRPIGTGPYVVKSFSGEENSDIEYLTLERNVNYRGSPELAFSTVVFKHYDDANALGSAMANGELDYLINAHFEPILLKDWTADEKTKIAAEYGTAVECLVLRVDWGERGDEGGFVSNPSVLLQDVDVVQALSAAIDRGKLAEDFYGYRTDDDNNLLEDRYGRPTCSIVVKTPPAGSGAVSSECANPHMGKANELLVGAGWDYIDDEGIRWKSQDEVRLELTLRYPDSTIRQGTAASIVSCWEAIGVAVQESADDPPGFFGFPPGSNCKNYVQFPVDVQLYTISFSGTDPEAFLRRWHSDEIPKPTSNQPPLDYLGPNVSRFHDEIYDGKVGSLAWLDEPGRTNEVRDLDDYLVERVVIPLIHRKKVSLYAAGLWNSGDPATGTVFRLNPWDSEFWNIENWNKEEE